MMEGYTNPDMYKKFASGGDVKLRIWREQLDEDMVKVNIQLVDSHTEASPNNHTDEDTARIVKQAVECG